MKKRILAFLTAVSMCFAMLTVGASAIDIDKTADSTLDENNQTTVTLSVGGTQDVENVAVLFVLDYSTSVDVRNAAADFVDELADKTNTNVKACVINYWADADTGTWTTINEDTEASDLLNQPTNKSGTNYHAGLLAAKEALKSDDITGYTTYLITISDGITYLWTDEETETTMSVYTELGNTTSNTNEVNDYRVITNDMFTALVNPTEAVTSAVSDTEEIAEEWSTSTKGYRATSEGDYVSADEFTAQTKLSGSEMAIYNTVSVYKELVSQVDNAYAFKLDESHWTSYPYGEKLMDYLASLSAKPSGAITATSASETFENVSDQILYEIMSGTVTDVIGEDFDWVGMDTVTLTVGGVEVEGTVDGNTVTFDNGNYVVTYYPDDEDAGTTEYFTWAINVPVEAANGLTLSYDLVLSEDYVLPESGTDVLPTNESAVIEYEDPDGDEKKETFPVPEVVIGGEKVSEPGMDKTIVITDDDGNKTEVDQDDVAAGETVNFALNSTIPEDLADHITFTYGEDGSAVGTVNSTTNAETDETVYDTYDLTFHDAMDDALELDKDSIVVAINDETLDSQYYTVTTENSDDCTFEVSIELLQLYTDGIISYSDFGAATITVTYSATLSEDAEAGAYTNTAWVTYDGTKSNEDEVEVDTYGIEVFKYDQDTAEYDEDGNLTATGLSGAEFKLYADEACTDLVATLTSGEDGYVTYDGLDAGTYYLVETEAPTGYVASSTPIVVTVGSDSEDTTNNVAYVTFANAPIPSTGGMGTTMYTVVGVCIVLIAGAALVVTRKNRREE